MALSVVSIIVGLLGVLLGGGVRAWEADRARRREADGLLSALVAEVEALTRLINHRQFLPGLFETGRIAQEKVTSGRGEEVGGFMCISLQHEYFSVYEASLSKLGLIHPYMSDRITRFYTYIKAAQENYDPKSPFQEGVSNNLIAAAINNDLQLLHTVVLLGAHIATFRDAKAPPGIVDPFPTDIPSFAIPVSVQGEPPMPDPAVVSERYLESERP